MRLFPFEKKKELRILLLPFRKKKKKLVDNIHQTYL